MLAPMRAFGSALALLGVLVPAEAIALAPAAAPIRAPGVGSESNPPPASTAPSQPSTPTPRSTSSTTPPAPGTIPPPPPGGAGGSVTTTDPFVSAEPVDLSDTWSYANRGGSAQPRYVRSGETVEVAPNPEGYYSGVSIEGNHVPPFPARSLGSKPALLTWTGFQRNAGGSRVFFELSADVTSKLDIRGSTVTLRLPNTKVNVRNNARYLDLRWFQTPVRSVKVTRRGRDTVATIVLKREATPSLVVLEGKAGYRLFVLEFAGTTEAVEAPLAPP
jgi:hypothetical protein